MRKDNHEESGQNTTRSVEVMTDDVHQVLCKNKKHNNEPESTSTSTSFTPKINHSRFYFV